MTVWQLTVGLQHLRNQVDYFFSLRDRLSDGTIGDAAHQAETSGHNPDDTPGSRPEWDGDPDSIPEVRAWDMDNNLSEGFDCQTLVDHIVGLKPSSVLRYVIYNRRIWKASNGWQSEAYTGASAHTEHVHFSGAYSQAADQNNTFNYRLEELNVPLTASDLAQIGAVVDARIDAKLLKQTELTEPDGTKTVETPIGKAVLSQPIPRRAGEKRVSTYALLADLGAVADETLAAVTTEPPSPAA